MIITDYDASYKTIDKAPYPHVTMHIENSSGKGGVTVVKISDDRDFYGVAICSPKDKFNQKKGEEIAYKRAIYGSLQISITHLHTSVCVPAIYENKRNQDLVNLVDVVEQLILLAERR